MHESEVCFFVSLLCVTMSSRWLMENYLSNDAVARGSYRQSLLRLSAHLKIALVCGWNVGILVDTSFKENRQQLLQAFSAEAPVKLYIEVQGRVRRFYILFSQGCCFCATFVESLANFMFSKLYSLMHKRRCAAALLAFLRPLVMHIFHVFFVFSIHFSICFVLFTCNKGQTTSCSTDSAIHTPYGTVAVAPDFDLLRQRVMYWERNFDQGALKLSLQPLSFGNAAWCVLSNAVRNATAFVSLGCSCQHVWSFSVGSDSNEHWPALSVPSMKSFSQISRHLSIWAPLELNPWMPKHPAPETASQLCFLVLQARSTAKRPLWMCLYNREGMNPQTLWNETITLIRLELTEGELINAHQEVAELFIGSALLSICSWHWFCCKWNLIEPQMEFRWIGHNIWKRG